MKLDDLWPGVACNGCGVVKSLSSFPVASYAKDTFRSRCKECINAVQRKWWRKSGDAKHKFNLRYSYGMTVEQYDAILASQNGRCAICEHRETFTRAGKIRKLCVDHDHATGIIRGLLCGKCNVALGYFQDSQEMLKAASLYLSKHQPKQNQEN